MKHEKGGENRTGLSKQNLSMGGVRFFTPGYWTNFFPLRRDKKEEI
jgi:hypothetical protein